MRTMSILLAGLAFTVSAWAAGARYALQVDGLACPFCAYGIEKRLRQVDGVASVEVDLQAGRVVVGMSNGHTLTEAQARAATREAGFTLHGFAALGADGK